MKDPKEHFSCTFVAKRNTQAKYAKCFWQGLSYGHTQKNQQMKTKTNMLCKTIRFSAVVSGMQNIVSVYA